MHENFILYGKKILIKGQYAMKFSKKKMLVIYLIYHFYVLLSSMN